MVAWALVVAAVLSALSLAFVVNSLRRRSSIGAAGYARIAPADEPPVSLSTADGRWI